MNEGQQLLFGIALDIKPAHDMMKNLKTGYNMAETIARGVSYTKDDLFSLGDGGKSFFEYKEGWTSFENAARLLQNAGDPVVPEDLDRVVADGKTLQALATGHGGLRKLFVPEIWQGRAEEMANRWYLIDKQKRSGISFEEIRRALAQHDGYEIREDQLKKANVAVADIRTAITNGNMEPVVTKLAAAGDHLRLEDLLFVDDDGDTVFHSRTAADNFGKAVAELGRHGLSPGLDFFLFTRGTRQSVIERLALHDALSQVFTVDLWRDKPDDMVKLYDKLTPVQQGKVNLPGLLSEIAESRYGDTVKFDRGLTLGQLIAPLNDASFRVGEGQVPPTRGLGLKNVWQRIAHVKEVLEEKGERVTLEHLRLKSGFSNETCLVQGVKHGFIDEIIDLVRSNGESFTADDFLAKADGSSSVLELLARQDRVGDVLQADLWAGKSREFVAVVAALPDDEKKKHGALIAETHSRINREAIRQTALKRLSLEM